MKLPNRSQLIAPAFAFLLVLSAMGGGFAVQPAAATHNCGELQSTAVFVTGPVGEFLDQTFNNADCTSNHKSQAIEDLHESDGNQTELDIYNSGLQLQADSERQRTLYQNYLNDTESAAWMRAEMAIAAAYENGSSKSLAKSKAREAINDYYAVKQANLIEEWNGTITSAHILDRTAENETGIDGYYVHVDHPSAGSSGSRRSRRAPCPTKATGSTPPSPTRSTTSGSNEACRASTTTPPRTSSPNWTST